MTAPYTKQTWTNGPTGNTPLSARRMGVIEQGIYDATAGVVALEEAVADLGSIDGLVQTGAGAPGAGTPHFPPYYVNLTPSPPTFWFLDSSTNLWHELAGAESLDVIQFGAGAPDVDTPVSPVFYADNSTTPFTLYAYNGSTWNAFGDSAAVELVQFDAGAPDGGTPTTPAFYVDNSTSPYNLYAWNGSSWNLLGDGGGSGGGEPIDVAVAQVNYTTVHTQLPPVIRLNSDDSTVTQDTLTGGVQYYIDPINSAVNFRGSVGTSFYIAWSAAWGEDDPGPVFWNNANPSLFRITATLRVFGLAQGDKVHFYEWGKSFTQWYSSGYLSCVFTDTFVWGTSAPFSLDAWGNFPRFDFELETASTTVGVDASFVFDMQIGTPDPGTPIGLTGLALDVSTPGEATLTWDGSATQDPDLIDVLIVKIDPLGGSGLGDAVENLSTNTKTYTGLSAGDYIFWVYPRGSVGMGDRIIVTGTVT